MKLIRNYFISLLSFIYLILEYLFWDTFLVPLYTKFKSLQLYQLFLNWISTQHKYLILTIFILFFAISEIMGVVALALLAQGMISLFVILYIVKFVPVAIAFTVLKNSKEPLLTINWFAYLYNGVLKIVHLIKSNQFFIKGKLFIENIKTKIGDITLIYNKEKHSKVKLFQRLFYYIINKKRR